MATTTIDNLAKEIEKELTFYSDDVKEKMEKELVKVAKDGAKALKSASPKGKGKRHYADGWTVQQERSRLGLTVTIYNKSKPGLAHLLEHGYVSRSGKRVEGKTHISPEEQKVINELERAISKVVS